MDIIIFILVLSLIVVIHEFGHFYFARKAGILCHEFAVGMGPVLYQKRKGEIAYSIRAIPLGGFVAMAGEEMSDAYIKKDQNIGIRINEEKEITDIVLDNDVKYDLLGKVVDFDLYGENNKELFITLDVNGEVINYKVQRNAKYRFKKDKELWITPAEKSFETKTLWQRFLVIFAGPALNFILGFAILFILAFFIGKPSNKAIVGNVDSSIVGEQIKKGDLISSVNGNEVTSWGDIGKYIYETKNNKAIFTVNGENVEIDLFIAIQGLGFANEQGNNDLVAGQIFGRAKDLKEKDKIISIFMGEKKNQTDAYVTVGTWNELINYVLNNKDSKKVFLTVERDGKQIEINYDNIPAKTLEKLGNDYIAYGAGITRERNFDLLYPFYYPFQKIGSDIKEMVTTLGLLISPNSGVGLKDLSGPVGIFSLVRDARSQGVISFFTLVAFLSVNIGFLNLLPIPALDGGRLVFLGYEAITRKKVSKKIENTIINITFILLLVLIVFVTYQDIFRLFK
ncbi:RIP metalloprotease RseP [Haploplasma axanthum]|uniref:Zinc metalloprotease SA1105 n=1 Tax=Haploplasma axanthum TaxID=29552 RepID=A0A449BD76_HAPAX|nr:RIP metalloprotease RseP [Haploplasma axanthum]VEU80260.1 Putative zinc metalloprotease SA1105 [Haploplasma axanthum]